MISSRATRPQRPDTARAQQREASKERLLQAAQRLFRERGYEAVSVTEIGAAAGLSASLINAYFGSKAGLFYALIARLNAPQFAACEAALTLDVPSWEKAERLIGIFTEHDLADPRLLGLMQGFSWTWPADIEILNALERDRLRAGLAQLLQEGMARGEFRQLAVPELVNSIWAIYTWGIRPAVFEGITAQECAGRILAELRNLLAPDGPTYP
jgi:AcrR family transcriptional regulator